MPRFFLEVTDGTNTFTDREGVTVRDLEEALASALRLATDLSKDGAYAEFYILVRDHTLAQVGRVDVTIRH
jgi:hypothetical protein